MLRRSLKRQSPIVDCRVPPMSDTLPLPIETDVATVARLRDPRRGLSLLLDVREQERVRDRQDRGKRADSNERTRPTALANWLPHRDRWIIVHCHHGGRSMQVTEALRHQGFNRSRTWPAESINGASRSTRRFSAIEDRKRDGATRQAQAFPTMERLCRRFIGHRTGKDAAYRCRRMSLANTTAISISKVSRPATVNRNSSCSLARFPATNS